MAFEVVAINPGKKARKKSTAKKGKKKMAAKKKGKKKPAKKRKRRNPSVKGAGRAIARRAKTTIAGMNVKKALTNTPAHVLGALAAKWAVKKFPGVEGGGDREDWTWGNYLAGGLGGFVAGAIAENIKRGSGQLMLEGALTLLGYKLAINEVVDKSEWLSEQLGADDEVRCGGDQRGTGDLPRPHDHRSAAPLAKHRRVPPRRQPRIPAG